ncbi:hypothetical protein [Entomobacter blattae]|uniref:Uncharacterized protein n=1 Tax=Entomobacter blattae TaxID=2762277 RepID=A0A7H1NT84_9PROT|nr:hypothetical protein [Entomobacter blattae]QNT78994.1 hypothetical protein JGUZn3_17780 [Entomobacter blattae]
MRFFSSFLLCTAFLAPFLFYENTQAREFPSPTAGKQDHQGITDNTPSSFATASESVVFRNQINQPNGVVGLDQSKKATVNNLVVKDKNNNRIIELRNGMPDYIAGAETAFMGGYLDSSGHKTSLSLYVSGRPYGPIGAGCVLCVINSQDDIQGGGGRPAISGVDYHGGGHAVALAGGFDQIGFYEFVDNTDARIIAEVSRYENKKIILKHPLTLQQLEMIHPSMYLQTNSIDLSIPEKNALLNELPKTRNYATYVDHVDEKESNVIYITGWAVPGAPSTINHLPGNVYDTWSSDYKKPMVFIGQPGKSFGRNLFMSYNGKKTGKEAKSLIHSMEAEEIDIFIHDELRPHHVSVHGVTISPIFRNQNPDVLTGDSYDMMLAGDIPNHLIVYEAPYNNVIKANSFYVHGNEGVGLTAHGQQQKRIGFEHDQWSDGAHQFRFVNYLSKDGPSANWPDTSMHLGLLIDGNQGDIKTGTNEGEIVWNKRDNNGGLSLCGGSGHCGLQQKFDGSLLLNSTYLNTNESLRIIKGGTLVFQSSSNPNAITINEVNEADLFFGSQSTGRVNLTGLNSVVLNSSGFASLGKNQAKGAQKYCSDCYSTLNPDHERGIPVWWNGARWTDALGKPVRH